MSKISFTAAMAFLVICSLVTGMALPAAIQVEPLAAAAVSQPVGERFGAASSHLKLYDSATMERELDAMQEAGITWVRCDFAWSDLKPVEGIWNLAGADLAVAKAGEHGVRVLGILGASPSWANGGMAWNYPPTDIDAWKDYVHTVVSRYRGKVAAWEVWNEENIDAFWASGPDATAYMNLLAAASPEIRAADPEATIVMGGVAGLGSDYLNACLSMGAAELIDAIAYHPYAETIGVEGQPEADTFRPKEELCRYLVDFVHWLVSQHTTKDLEIWITEVGWTTCQASPPGVDASTQASYMLRTLINYAATDVERVFYYSLRDEPGDTWTSTACSRTISTPSHLWDIIPPSRTSSVRRRVWMRGW